MQSGGLSSTSNYGDGWLTVVPYINRDRCNYPMPSLSLNEHFGMFTRDNAAYHWYFPTATPLPGSGYPKCTWCDQMFVTGCTVCNPSSQQGNAIRIQN